MSSYEAVIGLEVHVQLATRTKIFCGCAASFGAPPNENVCPVCLGMPGALPVLNKQAVEMAIKAAVALSCEVRPFSRFARKNYFYPDLPKGYQ
ncbi:MAG: Asp-tRNA(Asn)/Glu-tRNA(Gln) amidotransferase GatCAB subunit B, partial [Acidobacteria bacterium]|nr:Asp-tRNA(Asn)/Glu-tRNA(Gln) amidotransferase GatCAB subunit B [Acidobacteriota bacterium]